MERQQITKTGTSNQQKESSHPTRTSSPQPHSLHSIHQLRSALGNRTFGRFIQAKLKVSQPGDAYEQEADSVADSVMRMSDERADESVAIGQKRPQPHIQRECLKCEEEEKNQGEVQRKATDELEDAQLQTKGEAGASDARKAALSERVDTLKGEGQPLPTSVRLFFEPRFGYDFSQVRVHNDAESAASARAVQALAYTTGQDLVFGAGQYAPESTAGRRLLAHELTHVVQQRQPQHTRAAKASEGNLQRKSGGASLQSELSNSTCASCSGEKDEQRLDGLPDEVSDSLLLIDGPAPPQIAVHPSVSTPSVFRQPIPAPNSVRVMQNHQFPITAAHVAAGWRSGFGGVSEIEVSNGTTDYDGSNISEHFIGGFGNNTNIGGCANQSGQGGQGGSTFTVGDGVSFSQNGLNINLPAKHNTFYDMHIKGMTTNILPTGVNSQFSLCVQRYSFGGNTIWGRLGGLLPAIFFRLHGITRRTVGGQDVADIDLDKF